MRLGNNVRLKKVIERAQAGEPVTIGLIGGSITEGAGAAMPMPSICTASWRRRAYSVW